MPDVRRRDVGWLALAAGLGALAGLAWALWAPRDVLKIVNGFAVPDAMQSEAYIASDGIAFLLLLVIGALFSVALVLRWRMRPLVALGVGILCGAAGSLVFWIIATAVHAADVAAFPSILVPGSHPLAPLTIRMPAVYVTWPLAAAIVVAVQALVLWIVDRPDEQPGDDIDDAGIEPDSLV